MPGTRKLGRSAMSKGAWVLLCLVGGAMAATLLIRGSGSTTPTLPPATTVIGSTPVGPGVPGVPTSPSPGDPNESPPGLDTRPPNATCHAPERPVEQASVSLSRAISNVGFGAVGMARAPNDPSKWYLVDRAGVIKRFSRQGGSFSAAGDFVDLRDRVQTAVQGNQGEMGLLSLVMHPNFAANAQVYVYYSGASASGTATEGRISRFISRDNGLTLDKDSEEVLIRVPRTSALHWGGSLQFGPDGFLYAAFGDGRQHTAVQDLSSLLGKMIRIDVSPATGYAVPPSNPFVSRAGARPEIFALGFRNPWGWTIDRVSGDIWVGDVGEGAFEEVNRVVKGGNYGWPILEGNQCTNWVACVRTGLSEAALVYEHDDSGAGNAVIGGFVYHGDAIPDLKGRFVFADVSGKVYALKQTESGQHLRQQLAQVTGYPTIFGRDEKDELFLSVGWSLLAIGPSGVREPSSLPARLSQTGCFDAQRNWQPASGVLPFEVNSPLWSDGASKERFLALPDGKQIHIEANGDWTLPIGSVLIKHFRLGGRLIETRFLVRHTDGDWSGYTYEWAEDQSDAHLLESAKVKQVGTQTWHYPSRAQCMACHTEVAGRSLGLETGQLNRTASYQTTGRMANQLSTLNHIGLFDAPLTEAPAFLAALPNPGDRSKALDARARSYLHANCAMCHQPGGPGRGPEDFRFTTPAAAMGAIGVEPTQTNFGVEGAKLITPGRPDLSIVSLRAHMLETGRMPPLGRNLVDEAGVALLDQWIRSGLGMGVADTDRDGIADHVDNCPKSTNPTQLDADGDGFGNACDADFNGDRRVDALDEAIIRQAHGSSVGQPAFLPAADMDGDGRISALDMTRFRRRLGLPVGD